MTKLNCKVGGLAITVNTELWMNQGFIVRVIEWIGVMEWSSFGRNFKDPQALEN